MIILPTPPQSQQIERQITQELAPSDEAIETVFPLKYTHEDMRALAILKAWEAEQQ